MVCCFSNGFKHVNILQVCIGDAGVMRKEYKFILLPFLWIIFSLLTTSGYSETTYIPPGIRIPEEINKLPLEELSKKYQEMREKRKQSGTKWNKEFDNWNSQLHHILTELGLRLGNSSYSKADIKELLGAPDLIKTNEDNDFTQRLYLSSDSNFIKEKNVEYLVYYWRGSHDFLYFICKDGVVQKSSWYFAYE